MSNNEKPEKSVSQVAFEQGESMVNQKFTTAKDDDKKEISSE